MYLKTYNLIQMGNMGLSYILKNLNILELNFAVITTTSSKKNLALAVI